MADGCPQGRIRIAVIGGSGLYRMPDLTDTVSRTVETPFGKADNVLGGSGTFFSASASHLAPVQLVGVDPVGAVEQHGVGQAERKRWGDARLEAPYRNRKSAQQVRAPPPCQGAHALLRRNGEEKKAEQASDAGADEYESAQIEQERPRRRGEHHDLPSPAIVQPSSISAFANCGSELCLQRLRPVA